MTSNQSPCTCEICSCLLLKQYFDKTNLKDKPCSLCSQDNTMFPMNCSNKPSINRAHSQEQYNDNCSIGFDSFDNLYSTPDVYHNAEKHFGCHKDCTSRETFGSQIPFRIDGRSSGPTSRMVSNHSYNSVIENLQNLIIGSAQIQDDSKQIQNKEFESPYNCSYITTNIPGNCKSQKIQKMCEIDVPLLTFDSPLVPMENCRYDGLFIHDKFPCELPPSLRTTFDVTELFNEFINCYMNNTNTLYEDLNKYGFDKLKKDLDRSEADNYTPKGDYCHSCDILVDKVANLLMQQTDLFPNKKHKSCECRKRKTCFEEFDEKYGPMIERVLQYISQYQPTTPTKESKEKDKENEKEKDAHSVHSEKGRISLDNKRKSVAIDPFAQPSTSNDKKNKK